MTVTTKFWIKVLAYGITKAHPAIKKMEAYEKNGEKVFVQDLIVTNVYFNERKESTETQTEENEQTNLKNVDSVLFD